MIVSIRSDNNIKNCILSLRTFLRTIQKLICYFLIRISNIISKKVNISNKSKRFKDTEITFKDLKIVKF